MTGRCAGRAERAQTVSGEAAHREGIGWGGLWLLRGGAGRLRSKMSLASVLFAVAVAELVTVDKALTEGVEVVEVLRKF
jgi:hypothetical protein